MVVFENKIIGFVAFTGKGYERKINSPYNGNSIDDEDLSPPGAPFSR